MRSYFQSVGGNHWRKPEHETARRERAAAEGTTLRRKYAENHRVGDQLRRARKLGATTEPFRTTDIYERDVWTCGICTMSVDSALAYPHPGSVSLDHVVPLSLGGAHSAENTRCSHLRCNVRRGNRQEVAA